MAHCKNVKINIGLKQMLLFTKMRKGIITCKHVLMIITSIARSAHGLGPDEILCSHQQHGNDSLPFCLKEGYKKNDAPSMENKGPMNITVHVTIDDIADINDKDASITFSMSFGLIWTDDRLQILPNSSYWIRDESVLMANLDTNWLGYIWKPDMDILHIQKFKVKELFDQQHSLDLYSGNRMWYRFVVQVTLNCPQFNFKTY